MTLQNMYLKNAALTDFNGISPSDGIFVVGEGAKFVGESGATARTSLGVAIGSQVQAHGDVLDDLNTLGAAASDGQFIVATGAGTFAYESTTVARTSLGVGESDSPTFGGIAADGAATFNNSEADVDFRVGASTYPDAFKVDGATGRIIAATVGTGGGAVFAYNLMLVEGTNQTTDKCKFEVRCASNGAGAEAQVLFCTVAAPAGQYSKGALIFKGYGTSGRGDLLVCIDNGADSSEALSTDVVATFYRDGNFGVSNTAPESLITGGTNSTTQGVLRLWDGGGGNTPGHVILGSPNGTLWYVFVEDDGTLKIHNAAPTANADGSEVGSQT